MPTKSAVTIVNGQVGTASATDTIVGTIGYGASQSLTATQRSQALVNLGLNSAGVLSFRNRLINGAFGINQRSYASNTALSAGSYAHDRWKAGANGCTYTFTQSQPTTQISITAGTLTQVIEAAAVEGGSYTLSWTGTTTARVYQGSATGSYVASPLTVTGLSANTATIVEFGTGTLGQVQFEPGTAASAYELRPLTVETALCQRYYLQWTTTTRADIAPGYSPSATQGIYPIALPVPMQRTPTISSSNIAVLNGSGSPLGGSSQAVQFVTDKTVEIAIGVSSGLTAGQGSVLTIGGVNSAGGLLIFNAEL